MKMHGLRIAGVLLIAGCLSGCIQQIDDQIAKVDQDNKLAWDLTRVALDNGLVGYEQTEDSRSVLQRNEVDRRLKELLDRHTSRDGRLVSASQPGEERPMLRSDIEQMIRDRDGLLLQAELAHRQNVKVISLMRDAVAKYDAMMTLITDRKADWLEKRKSAAAAVNAAITALSASGVTAGIAALVF